MNDILQGDALNVLNTMPAEIVHAVITSPPYWSLRDYQLPPTDWPAVTFTPAAGLPPLTIEPMSCCLGLEPEPWAFVAHLVEVMREVRRVLRGDGTVWLNLGDSYAQTMTRNREGVGDGGERRERWIDNSKSTAIGGLKPKDLVGIPWMCAKALQADGWWLRSDVIWAKPNPMPESVTDRPTKAHEYLFLLAKSERYYYDAEAVREKSVDLVGSMQRYRYEFSGTNGSDAVNDRRTVPEGKREFSGYRNRRTVWTIATQPYAEAHFATFPPALVEPCLLASTSARGVCPACGAGWERVVEKTNIPANHKNSKFDRGKTAINGNGRVQPGERYQNIATGWRPTCDCNAGDPTPAVVLDPFFGSGTVGAVAIECGRRYVGIELNEEYIKLARKRLAGAQPALIAKGLE